MKILFFVASLQEGGLERQLVELIKGLQQYPEIECELVLTDKVIRYTEIFETKVKIHYIERKKLKKDPRLLYLFFRIAKKFKPDLINVWDEMVAFYSIPTRVFLRIPVINSEIQSAPDYVTKEVKWHQFIKRFSDVIVANSIAGLISYKHTIDKGKVIYNGFDFKRIENLSPVSSIREKYNIKSKYVVCMAATISKYKDYTTYVQAATIVLNKNYDVCFLSLGGGDDTPYKQMINEKHKNNILFLGLLKDVESIVNASDIGVLSTYTEGISNSIIEYMALCKPVVATDGGGTNELIIDNVTGYLLPQKSPEIMAEKIIYLLENPEVSKKMGKEGYKIIVEKFSLKRMVSDYYNLFNEVAKKSYKKFNNEEKRTIN